MGGEDHQGTELQCSDAAPVEEKVPEKVEVEFKARGAASRKVC